MNAKKAMSIPKNGARDFFSMFRTILARDRRVHCGFDLKPRRSLTLARLCLLTVTATLFLSGCAFNVPRAPLNLNSQSKTIAPPVGKARIYFIRPNEHTGIAVPMTVQCDDKFVGLISRGTYLYRDVEPGAHVIQFLFVEIPVWYNENYSTKIPWQYFLAVPDYHEFSKLEAQGAWVRYVQIFGNYKPALKINLAVNQTSYIFGGAGFGTDFKEADDSTGRAAVARYFLSGDNIELEAWRLSPIPPRRPGMNCMNVDLY